MVWANAAASEETQSSQITSPEGGAAAERGLDRRRVLKALVKESLSERERLVVILYYHESLTFREIGCVLDLSESKVAHIHRSVLLRLQVQTGWMGSVRQEVADTTNRR